MKFDSRILVILLLVIVVVIIFIRRRVSNLGPSSLTVTPTIAASVSVNSWITSVPAGFKMWPDYVSTCDPLIYNFPKGSKTGSPLNAGYGTLETCANACRSDPTCTGFARRAWQGWNWTTTTDPNNPASPYAYCQKYKSAKLPTESFATSITESSACSAGRYYQKV